MQSVKEIPQKKIATFLSPLFATHSGTLKLGDMNISPVLYVPGASVNVLSCAQAEDHGLRVVHKEGLFLLKQGNLVVKSFKRQGRLYIGHSEDTYVNAIQHRSSSAHQLQDWHVLLGHPSDQYLKIILDKIGVKATKRFRTQFAACRVSIYPPTAST